MKAAKAWVAFVGAVVTVLSGVIADEIVTGEEAGTVAQVVVSAAFALATAYTTWRVPNTPE